MDLTKIIREIARGRDGARDLEPVEAALLYGQMLDDRIPELESGAIAIALRMKGESDAELTAFLSAIDARLPVIALPKGKPSPVVVPTYNGARRHANLTPLLILALSELGLPTLAHGLEEEFGRVTSAEILKDLGVRPAATPAAAADQLLEKGCAFLTTKTLLPGLAAQLNLRARLGLRNCAHSLVKMLDPFLGKGVVLASATHPAYLDAMRTILLARGQTALLFRATEGEPYANPRRCPSIEFLAGNESRVLCDAEGESLKSLPVLPEEASPESTVEWIRKVLDRQLVLPAPIVRQLACCLLASGACADLQQANRAVAARFSLV